MTHEKERVFLFFMVIIFIFPRRWSRESLRPFFLYCVTVASNRKRERGGEEDDEPLENLDLDYANGHPGGGAHGKSSPSHKSPPAPPPLVGVRFLTSSNTRTHWFKKMHFLKLLKKYFYFYFFLLPGCVSLCNVSEVTSNTWNIVCWLVVLFFPFFFSQQQPHSSIQMVMSSVWPVVLRMDHKHFCLVRNIELTPFKPLTHTRNSSLYSILRVCVDEIPSQSLYEESITFSLVGESRRIPPAL